MSGYEFKTKPFKHQRELFERTREFESWGLFWEQGTGKTKPTIDTAAWLYEKGDINAALVVAPNGVHRNWINDEIPKHMPDRVVDQMRTFYYEAPKAKTKWHKQESQSLIKFEGLAFLAISYNGFMTKAGKKYIWKFLSKRHCLYILDESHHIKAPSAKRTISIVASGKYAPYRRILTGTPVAEGPFGAYTQVRFLRKDFWLRHGLGSYAAIKNYFGIYRTAQAVLAEEGYDPGYDQLLGYKNLGHMHEILKEISDRITKKDAGLDLPPKLWSKRYFEMSPEQKRLFKELAETYVVQLRDATIEAELVITRLLRLQQIACGYVQTSSEEPIRLIDKKNRRLDFTVEEVLGDTNLKTIVWSRFTHDIDQLMDALGAKAVRYDGKVSNDAAEKAYKDFQYGDAQFFVGNPAKGKEGLDLSVTRTMVYYANSFKIIERMQSEDRPHRIGLKYPLHIIDISAIGSTDNDIIGCLRGKFDIQSQLTGDKLKEWL